MRPARPGLLLSLAFVCVFPTYLFAQDERGTATTANYRSISEAFAHGQVKAMLRYSGQYRDSNLHLLQDSSTPDISDEKVQQYSALERD